MADDFLKLMSARRNEKVAERDRVDVEIKQLDELIRAYQRGRAPKEKETPRVSRSARATAKSGTVKDAVFEVLRHHPDGLATAALVSEASRMGRELNRGSVASLLSVQAKKGALEYDGHVYRLKAEASGGDA